MVTPLAAQPSTVEPWMINVVALSSFATARTAWSLSGQHTGRTDIPLTKEGRAQARRLGAVLADQHFAQVLSVPLSRALD